MNRVALVALFCFFFALASGFLDSNGVERSESELDRIAARSIAPRDDETCGSAQMNFYWGSAAQQSGSPRLATIFFFYNGTFHDNTYDYSGDWVLFGENGDNILTFNYPSAKYVSPDNRGAGSMISHSVCGYWDFGGFKWYCPSMCGV